MCMLSTWHSTRCLVSDKTSLGGGVKVGWPELGCARGHSGSEHQQQWPIAAFLCQCWVERLQMGPESGGERERGTATPGRCSSWGGGGRHLSTGGPDTHSVWSWGQELVRVCTRVGGCVCVKQITGK